MSTTNQNMGIKADKAHESPSASAPKVAPTAGGVTAPGVLSEILARQARLYGQVTNEVWFARRIVADPANADATKATAEKYGIDWQKGLREITPLPAARIAMRQAQ
jgi:hypothetical protein